MSVEEVKRELPTVKLRVGDRVVEACVCGSRQRFATVYYLEETVPNYVVSFEFSWAAVARAATFGTILCA